VSEINRIDLGHPTILEFRGPDAVRFLNGQLTQDVRRVSGGKVSLSSCVTDAKGRLQFRVNFLESDDGALWITGLTEWAENLEARLTRYLIADDVEVSDLTGKFSLYHFTHSPGEAPQGVIARESNRYGISGVDWWVPCDQQIELSGAILEGDSLEALRISNKIPAWGAELQEEMLPPEALLEETDISYNKGCYIGQEVISRIKSAGKVNRYLTRFTCDADIPIALGLLENAEGKAAGELTSISPIAKDGNREALGYVKRGATEVFFRSADGKAHPIAMS
jgi:tRNA-modifying protein YgfZ